MMIVRGVNVFPTQIEEQILTVEGLAPHYVCVLTRSGRLDEMRVRVEAATGGVDRGALSAALARRVKDVVGVSVDVEVLAPRTLDRSMGKAVRIEDRR
jgi:phenylacetate-CoA ligase